MKNQDEICPQCDMGVSCCMCNEFNLSDEREKLLEEIRKCMFDFLTEANLGYLLKTLRRLLQEHDEEFIRRLKEATLPFYWKRFLYPILDKLAGDKLNENGKRNKSR